jgi:hypothetical protein
MHGPPLTPQEAVATVARKVRRLEAAGLDRDQAIRRAAAEHGIEPEKVRWCAETAPGGPSARPIEPGHGSDRPRPHSERGLHPVHPRKENTFHTTPGSRKRRPRAPLAVAVAALVAGLLALASPAGAAASTFNVNPVAGRDTNPGTATSPLKTLTGTLKLARSGDRRAGYAPAGPPCGSCPSAARSPGSASA